MNQDLMIISRAAAVSATAADNKKDTESYTISELQCYQRYFNLKSGMMPPQIQ